MFNESPAVRLAARFEASRPIFTKKHYEMIAGVLRAVHAEDRRYGGDSTYNVAHALADMFERDNPKFARERFLTYDREGEL